MPEFHIRPATLTDTETLSHIGAATFIESFITDIEGPAMIAHCSREHSQAAYTAYLSKPSAGCWLAEYADTRAPIGYALNCPADLPVETAPDDIELKRIYLLSRFHGQGVADKLLNASIAHARGLNAPRLLLGTYERNYRATAFYQKYGFETVGTRQFDVGGKIYDDIVMAKTL